MRKNLILAAKCVVLVIIVFTVTFPLFNTQFLYFKFRRNAAHELAEIIKPFVSKDELHDVEIIGILVSGETAYVLDKNKGVLRLTFGKDTRIICMEKPEVLPEADAWRVVLEVNKDP